MFVIIMDYGGNCLGGGIYRKWRCALYVIPIVQRDILK